MCVSFIHKIVCSANKAWAVAELAHNYPTALCQNTRRPWANEINRRRAGPKENSSAAALSLSGMGLYREQKQQSRRPPSLPRVTLLQIRDGEASFAGTGGSAASGK